MESLVSHFQKQCGPTIYIMPHNIVYFGKKHYHNLEVNNFTSKQSKYKSNFNNPKANWIKQEEH